MVKKPTREVVEADPRRGDEILKRMLQSKPKPHKEMVKEGRSASKKNKAISKKADG